jgi:hypothetical protein
LLDSNRSALWRFIDDLLFTVFAPAPFHCKPCITQPLPQDRRNKIKAKQAQPSFHVDSFGFSRYENEDIYTPTRNKMIAALHKRTEIGREVIDEEALRACPVKEVCH